MCRTLIDTGARGSYVSAKLINIISQQPNEIKTQLIDTLIVSKTTRIEMYHTEVTSLDETFKITVKLVKVDKPELLSVIVLAADTGNLWRRKPNLAGDYESGIRLRSRYGASDPDLSIRVGESLSVR